MHTEGFIYCSPRNHHVSAPFAVSSGGQPSIQQSKTAFCSKSIHASLLWPYDCVLDIHVVQLAYCSDLFHVTILERSTYCIVSVGLERFTYLFISCFCGWSDYCLSTVHFDSRILAYCSLAVHFDNGRLAYCALTCHVDLSCSVFCSFLCSPWKVSLLFIGCLY